MSAIIWSVAFENWAKVTERKTIFSRIGRVSDDSEEALSADEVSKIAKAYKSVGISIYDANGEMRDIDDTLSELSKGWDSMTDATRSYIAEQSAGVRQKNTFLVMMDEYKEAMALAEEAANSAGFSDKVQEKFDSSLTAKMNTLKATSQELWNDIFSGDGMKSAVSGLTSLLKVLDGIVETVGLLPTILGAVGGYIGFKGGGRVKMFALIMFMPPKSLTVMCTSTKVQGLFSKTTEMAYV